MRTNSPDRRGDEPKRRRGNAPPLPDKTADEDQKSETD
jgi:hypothetical protein